MSKINNTKIIKGRNNKKQGSRMVQPVPKEYNVFAYLIKGKGVFVQTNNNKLKRKLGNIR